MHEGACETGSQIPRVLARGIWRTVQLSDLLMLITTGNMLAKSQILGVVRGNGPRSIIIVLRGILPRTIPIICDLANVLPVLIPKRMELMGVGGSLRHRPIY